MNNARRDGSEFWRSRWFWAALALASMLPMVVPSLVMMPDFFSHTGRYHVMNHGAESPFLPRYYRFEWRLMGNLGVDLLMVPLGHWLPTETAARVAVAIIPPLTVIGIRAVATAVWGRVEAPALLSLSFIYTFTLLYGFVNYHLGLALALLVAALWIRNSAWPPWRRAAIVMPLATLIWIVHLAAWAVLLVIVGCWELALAWRQQRHAVAALWQSVWRSLPLALPIPIMLWQLRGGAPVHLYSWDHKGEWLISLMLSQSATLAMIEVLTVAVALVLALTTRGIRGNAGIALATVALAVLFVALPNALLGSFYADLRLLAPLMMLGCLAFAIPSGERATITALIGIAVFGLRIGEVTLDWHRRGAAAMADLAGLDGLPLGARIAVVKAPDVCKEYALGSLAELPSLAIVRRDAFVNTEWDLLGPQLMQPIWNRDHGYNDQRSVVRCSRNRPLAATVAVLPRARFNYVWVFGHAPLAVPWLQLVHAGPNSRLYAITPARAS